MEQKIFILGDSRTGTTSLFEFFRRVGFSAIHYFVDEAGLQRPLHKFHDENWNKVHTFIEENSFQVFSDYPTRTFYKELAAAYPDSYFILSERKSVEKWQNSMVRFFEKQDITFDLDKLTQAYLLGNRDIGNFFEEGEFHFLKICIDDENMDNTKVIKDFLQLDTEETLLQLNKSNRTSA